MLRFVTVFGALALLLRTDFVMDGIRRPYCELLARSLSGCLDLLGLEVQRISATVTIPGGRGLTIIPEWDGLILLCLFSSGVAAVPRRRALAPYGRALAVVVFLAALSWVRLLTLTLAGFYWAPGFELMQGPLVQAILVFVVAAVFFAWLGKLEPDVTEEARPLADV
jgi:hypothetical protein